MNRSTDAAKQVTILMDAILNSYLLEQSVNGSVMYLFLWTNINWEYLQLRVHYLGNIRYIT